jgi:DNA-binding transcriptional regulator YhcF (GntR family)
MYGGHFFLGKLITVELSPMKPNEMVDAYKSKWGTVEPFTEEALLLTAQLSRGIFRRFLKYIRKSIETAAIGNSNFPITSEIINREITTKQLVADMDLELTDVFQNNREHKEMAVKTLHLLREKQVNQKEIAEYLNVDDATASRLIKKLETYGYITRRRGSGTVADNTIVTKTEQRFNGGERSMENNIGNLRHLTFNATPTENKTENKIDYQKLDSDLIEMFRRIPAIPTVAYQNLANAVIVSQRTASRTKPFILNMKSKN